MELHIDSAEEQRILSALRERDLRHAAGLMVQYHANAVFAVCYDFVSEAEAAEDLTQSSFAQAFASLAEWRGQVSPREWLISVAQCCCQQRLPRNAPTAAASEEQRVEGARRSTWPMPSESLRRRLEMLAAAL